MCREHLLNFLRQFRNLYHLSKVSFLLKAAHILIILLGKVGSVLSLSEAVFFGFVDTKKVKSILSELDNVGFDILYMYSNIASIESCIWASSILTEKSHVFYST